MKSVIKAIVFLVMGLTVIFYGGAYMLPNIDKKNGSALTVRSGEDDYQFNYGVGVSYALLDNLNFRAEWERFEMDVDNIDHIDLLTAGVAMKF